MECQKEFLFNSRYEPTEWSFGHKIPRCFCNKGRVNICCDIPEDLNSNLCTEDITDIHKKILNEMIKVCEKCKYYN